MEVKIFNSMKWVALISIFVLGFLLRFWHFSVNPPSLNWDEVSLGYNAYSILKTGKDEFGTYLPKNLRSLDDYKMPVYLYSTVASVSIFGLNDFAVRIPSAIFGLLTVILIYFFVKELYDDQVFIKLSDKKSVEEKQKLKYAGKTIAIISAVLLAIVPWHVQYSRMASEANVGAFFLVAGALTFLSAVRKKLWMLPLSVMCFGFAAYSYKSIEVISPLVGFMLVILYRKQLITVRKKLPLIVSGVLVVLIGLSLVQDTFSSGVNIRIKGTSVFDTSDFNNAFSQNIEERQFDGTVDKDRFSGIFHNNRLVYAGTIIRGYLVHFSPSFWFFDYDQRQHPTPFVGLLYVWMLFFMPTGTYFVIKRFPKRSSIIIFSWLLISPIPASITRDIPHAIRVLPILIPLIIITASGIFAVYEVLCKSTIKRYLFVSVIFIFMVFSSAHYFHQYDTHLPFERSKDWVYGRKELVKYVEANKAKYKKVVISTSLEWPHIFFLYYSRYDPVKYLAQGGTVSGGWGEERNHYDTYQFRKFNTSVDFLNLTVNDTLYAGLPKEFPSTIKPLSVIKYLNGDPAIWIVDGTSFSGQTVSK